MSELDKAALRRLFAERGTETSVDGSSPLLIRDERYVWMVQDGHADVFAVTLRGGEIVRQRRYLFGVDRGQLAFGYHAGDEAGPRGVAGDDGRENAREPAGDDEAAIAGDEPGAGAGVDASGADGGSASSCLLIAGLSGTKLLRMEKAEFFRIVHESPAIRGEAAAAVDAWIQVWSTVLATAAPAEQTVGLEPGIGVVAAQSTLRAATGTAWVRVNAGKLHWMGDAALAIDGPDRFFPLAPASWAAAEEAADLSVFGTPEWLAQDESAQGLSAFHAHAAHCLHQAEQFRERFEHERLRLRAEQDRLVMDRALKRLAAVTGSPEAGAGASGEPHSEDGLYAAARLVGDACGIQVKPIRAGQLRLSRDPVSEIAKASGFRSRQVMLRDDWWRRDNGPLLAFIEEGGQPVALLPQGPNRYRLVNPADGSESVVTEQLANTLETAAHMFYRPLPSHPLSVLDLLKFGSHRMVRKDAATVLALAVAGGLLGLFVPVANGILFDTVIPSAVRGPLLQMGLILLSVAASTTLFELMRSVATLRIEGRMDGAIQAAVWDRLLQLPASFFRGYAAGDLAGRANSINAIRQMLSGVALNGLFSGLFSCFNFFLLFHYDVRLALTAAALVLIPMTVTIGIGIIQTRKQRRLLQATGRLTGTVLQIINGISKFRMAAAEKRAFFLWAKLFGEMKETSFQARKISDLHAVFNAFFPIATSIVLFYALASHPDRLSAGQFIAFFSAFTAFLGAMIGMSTAVVTVIGIVPQYERARPILQAQPEVLETMDDPGELTGAIEVRHVSFRYAAEQPLVLNDMSMSVRPGEFIALVGASGCGKSTLLRLLLGFEKAESGSIFLDGQDLKSLDIRAVRKQLGVVLQHGKVMAGDIYANIVGSTNLTHEDAWEAARMAGFDEDIRQMPMGMHTVISEGGGTLSGGQRQRLLIARALARRPKILFFDEATSALDNRTQAIVSESLEKLRATRVVIAHRLSTIRNADRIFVLDKGRLVQAGTYADLMAQEGLFMELAKRQLA